MSQAVSSVLGDADGFGPLRKLVLDTVPSPLTRAMCARALDDFFAWWDGQGRPPFTRSTVQAWRAALEAKGLAPASVNQKLSAVRKLAAEASYNGLLDRAAAQVIRDIRGAKLDQIQLSLGHASIQTAEQYLGVQQDLTDAPCDYLHLKVE